MDSQALYINIRIILLNIHYKKTLFYLMSKKTAMRVWFDMEVLRLDVT